MAPEKVFAAVRYMEKSPTVIALNITSRASTVYTRISCTAPRIPINGEKLVSPRLFGKSGEPVPDICDANLLAELDISHQTEGIIVVAQILYTAHGKQAWEISLIPFKQKTHCARHGDYQNDRRIEREHDRADSDEVEYSGHHRGRVLKCDAESVVLRHSDVILHIGVFDRFVAHLHDRFGEIFLHFEVEAVPLNRVASSQKGGEGAERKCGQRHRPGEDNHAPDALSLCQLVYDLAYEEYGDHSLYGLEHEQRYSYENELGRGAEYEFVYEPKVGVLFLQRSAVFAVLFLRFLCVLLSFKPHCAAFFLCHNPAMLSRGESFLSFCGMRYCTALTP